MLEQSEFYKLIKEICIEKNIKMRSTSFGYITELVKNKNIKHMVGNCLELNSSNSAKIATDKFATFSVLKQMKVPTIEYNMIFNPETRKDYGSNDVQKAIDLFFEYNKKVILKLNNSSEGKDVYLINSEQELINKILYLFSEKNDNLSICPYYNINVEYRAIYLDGEILFCYEKQKPYIIGDSKKTLRELISQNEYIDSVYEELDLNYIPQYNEKIEISWKHNLSQGAIPEINIEKEKRKQIYDIAIRAGKAIGIRFASIDIAEISTDELLVMEINSSVCMNKFAEIILGGRDIEKDIFSKAIDKMFE